MDHPQGLDQAKQAIRDRVWTLLEEHHAAPSEVHGRIPAFTGADAAADRLATLRAWQRAKVIKAVPDKAQLPVRARALTEGKVVYMAVPTEEQPFYLLNPASLTVPPAEAASSKIAAKVAQRVDVDKLQPVDLIICGSVAVNRRGVRLGKGAGYSDIEVALLQEANLITPTTVIVTTVHPLQVTDHDLPHAEHDFTVDLIITPDEVIQTGHMSATTRSRRSPSWLDSAASGPSERPEAVAAEPGAEVRSIKPQVTPPETTKARTVSVRAFDW